MSPRRNGIELFSIYEHRDKALPGHLFKERIVGRQNAEEIARELMQKRTDEQVNEGVYYEVVRQGLEVTAPTSKTRGRRNKGKRYQRRS